MKVRVMRGKSALSWQRSRSWATVACAMLALLAACGEQRNRGTTQVVASVNGTEITVHQMQYELARSRANASTQDAEALARAVDALIDQQLVIEQAESEKLDRDPQVLRALEHARRQVLAQAFVERKLDTARPTGDEIKTFYSQNPQLFQKRRIYSFRDFILDRASFTDGVRRALEEPRARDDLGATLRKAGIAYREASSARSAEQLPMENLGRIASMAKGEVSVALEDRNAILMQLVDAAEQPVSLEQATPFIEQYLFNLRRKEAIEAKLKELRASAKITYAGSGKRQPAEPAPVREQPQAGVPKGAATVMRDVMDEQAVRKSLKGLVGQ